MAQSLRGKHVLVVGLGLHGGAIGTIQWLASQGAVISVSDTKTKEQLASSGEKLKDIPNITYHFGNQDDVSLEGVDMLIRNPGVPRTAPVLLRAKENNIPIEMDSSLFFAHCPSKNIIGITGSKGKTTTSVAIATVMKAIDPQTVAVGVDGVSPLGALPLLTNPVIFELSSWRLEALQEKNISPHIAVATSIYKDHLNTYASFEEYIDTKKQIIRNQSKQDIAILNKDDDKIRTWETDVQGKLYWYSLQPLEEGEKGIFIKNNKALVIPAPEPGSRHAWMPDQVGHDSDGESPAEICSVSDIPHTSEHELRNKLPAILIGLLHGGEIADILQALQSQPVLAHRLQLVREVSGVSYINDSTATMPDATIAALKSFAEQPLILILGGSDKALEFQELAHEISLHKNIKHLIWLPGTATDRMKQEILPVTSAHSYYAASMDQAVTAASQFAQEGDTVLLSPGATSFGLFLHEFDRGDAFIRAVEATA